MAKDIRKLRNRRTKGSYRCTVCDVRHEVGDQRYQEHMMFRVKVCRCEAYPFPHRYCKGCEELALRQDDDDIRKFALATGHWRTAFSKRQLEMEE